MSGSLISIIHLTSTNVEKKIHTSVVAQRLESEEYVYSPKHNIQAIQKIFLERASDGCGVPYNIYETDKYNRTTQKITHHFDCSDLHLETI